MGRKRSKLNFGGGNCWKMVTLEIEDGTGE
jgi:hypothetical protein